jgi:hypothetical protein
MLSSTHVQRFNAALLFIFSGLTLEAASNHIVASVAATLQYKHMYKHKLAVFMLYQIACMHALPRSVRC